MTCKPLISRWRKVWDCKLPDFWTTGIWGFGTTPLEAYRDWLRQMVQRGAM